MDMDVIWDQMLAENPEAATLVKKMRSTSNWLVGQALKADRTLSPADVKAALVARLCGDE